MEFQGNIRMLLFLLTIKMLEKAKQKISPLLYKKCKEHLKNMDDNFSELRHVKEEEQTLNILCDVIMLGVLYSSHNKFNNTTLSIKQSLGGFFDALYLTKITKEERLTIRDNFHLAHLCFWEGCVLSDKIEKETSI